MDERSIEEKEKEDSVTLDMALDEKYFVASIQHFPRKSYTKSPDKAFYTLVADYTYLLQIIKFKGHYLSDEQSVLFINQFGWTLSYLIERGGNEFPEWLRDNLITILYDVESLNDKIVKANYLSEFKEILKKIPKFDEPIFSDLQNHLKQLASKECTGVDLPNLDEKRSSALASISMRFGNKEKELAVNILVNLALGNLPGMLSIGASKAIVALSLPGYSFFSGKEVELEAENKKPYLEKCFHNIHTANQTLIEFLEAQEQYIENLRNQVAKEKEHNVKQYQLVLDEIEKLKAMQKKDELNQEELYFLSELEKNLPPAQSEKTNQLNFEESELLRQAGISLEELSKLSQNSTNAPIEEEKEKQGNSFICQ